MKGGDGGCDEWGIREPLDITFQALATIMGGHPYEASQEKKGSKILASTGSYAQDVWEGAHKSLKHNKVLLSNYETSKLSWRPKGHFTFYMLLGFRPMDRTHLVKANKKKPSIN